jgi:hypothetical protein
MFDYGTGGGVQKVEDQWSLFDAEFEVKSLSVGYSFLITWVTPDVLDVLDWNGRIRILRKADEWPQSWDDPDATIVADEVTSGPTENEITQSDLAPGKIFYYTLFMQRTDNYWVEDPVNNRQSAYPYDRWGNAEYMYGSLPKGWQIEDGLDTEDLYNLLRIFGALADNIKTDAENLLTLFSAEEVHADLLGMIDAKLHWPTWEDVGAIQRRKETLQAVDNYKLFGTEPGYESILQEASLWDVEVYEGWRHVMFSNWRFGSVTPTLVGTYFPLGLNWSSVAAPEWNGWYSIAYGNGVFIAVSDDGTDRVMLSTDRGGTWSTLVVALENWYSIAYGNGVFVAVAYNGANRVMRSTDDGATWTTALAAEMNSWLSVAYGNGVFVAVASDGTNRVMRSIDYGATWTTAVAAEANSWQYVAYGNNVFVAVARNGTNRVMRSIDYGATWTTAVAAEANSWREIAYGNGVFVAVADDGVHRVMRSENDGVTWTAITAAKLKNWQGITYGNGMFIAVGQSGTTTERVMRSIDDGVTWHSALVAATQLNAWQSVAYGEETFIAVCYDGTEQVMKSVESAIPEMLKYTNDSFGWYAVNGLGFRAEEIEGVSVELTDSIIQRWYQLIEFSRASYVVYGIVVAPIATEEEVPIAEDDWDDVLT